MKQRHSWLQSLALDSGQMEEAGRFAATAQAARFLLGLEISPQELLTALSSHYRIASILNPQRYQIEDAALGLLPEEDIRRLGVLPLFLWDQTLYVATSNPEDMDARDYIRKAIGLEVEVVVVLPADLEAAQNRIYTTTQRSGQAMEVLVREIGKNRPHSGEGAAYGLEDREAPTTKLVDRILSQAVHLRASDIHLEPHADKACLRYRVDGRLHEYPGPPLSLLAGVISRIKIASSLDIAERRLPQDGRTSIQVGDTEYDLRVSIIPYLYGEGAVIRVLNTRGTVLDLGALGFESETLERYEGLIQKPHGIVLVTGPTGSGKSTTLYATLKRIFNPSRKFITLEDPVEHQLEGINQIQIHADIGLTFGSGLRAILRHDPDVIMLGEIRDLETAEIAVRASLTGHLMFSTLHTNSASLAVTRLVDMGLPIYQITASLIGVLAQRLLRRLCPKCKQAVAWTDLDRKTLGLALELEQKWEAHGCPECNFLGYHGRVAIYELLEMTPRLRRFSTENLDDGALREHARQDGFVSMRENAVRQLATGVTSLEEVLSATMADESYQRERT